MTRRTRLSIAVLAGLSLLAASCGSSDDGGTEETSETAADSAETTAAATEETAAEEPTEETDAPVEETVAPAEELEASDIGVTEETITIGVAISDLEAVRAAGISIPETLTSDHLFDRWNKYAEAWNEAGGINGRTVVMERIMWDPLDPTSFDAICAEATIDKELFAVVNGTGLSGVAMQCMVDAGVPVFYGDVVSQTLLDSGLMITLAPPSEVTAAAGVEAWIEQSGVAPGATVGVLASNSPVIQAAGRAAEAALEEAGYTPILIETNSLAGDNAATNEEAGAAVGTFLASGAVHAFVATPFTENRGFWNAAKDQLTYTMLDTASSQCSTFGLSRAPAEAAGGVCATAFDHPTSEGQGVREDTEFEAECRAFFDANFTEYYGGPSNSGVPAGQVITDADGKVLISDYAPQECTISNLLVQGLTDAGVNPTRDSLIEAVLNLGEQPFALGSGGSGTLAPDKPYLADKVHPIVITTASVDVKADANGTYNGCAAPVNCGIVIGDWVAIG